MGWNAGTPSLYNNNSNKYYHFVQVLPIKITIINRYFGRVELTMFLSSFKCLKDEISS